MNFFTLTLFLMLSGILDAKCQEGIILLHGLCRSASSMKPMERFLTQEGYTVLNADYASRTRSVKDLADEVIPKSIENPCFQHCERIHFVTHSLGGILVRSYFSRNLPGKPGRVVMLGPPNQGSEVVDRLKDWWFFKKLNGPAGSELGTDSHSTPNSLGPVDFDLGIIAGDRSINWINSLWIHGTNDGKVSVTKTKVTGMKAHRVIHTSHPFMMRNSEVFRDTLAFLKNGDFPG